MKKLCLLLAACFAVAACDKIKDQAVGTLAANMDNHTIRNEFVTSCAQEGLNILPAAGQENAESLCGCLYDETKKMYADETEFFKAILDLGLNTDKDDHPYYQKIAQVSAQCVKRVVQ
ncbi:hypothetical protein L4G92_01325 [Neisseria sp. ZJ106]|uniref:Lipoprotein n=1 Tax=Neisseria lisongii TaxID=2912188 RepID=A0ABY7RL35_9NEIS|nr:hypothetical protein [Neisseria lisongii]MCF7520696.1 hypothetical protein [Neisseria lisongii]WCL72344.1 hypothetical protein PJU73_04395 [Neisseria lisongii]